MMAGLAQRQMEPKIRSQLLLDFEQEGGTTVIRSCG